MKPKLKKGQFVGTARDAFENKADVKNLENKIKEEKAKEAAKKGTK